MKEIYKEFKKIFDEYGSVCLGIVAIIAIGLGMTFLITCGIVAFVMWMFGLSFSWTIGIVTWLILVVIFKTMKNYFEKKDDKNQI